MVTSRDTKRRDEYRPEAPWGAPRSPTSYPYTGDVDSRCFPDHRLGRLSLAFGRQRPQVAALQHDAGNEASSQIYPRGPQERRRVAMKQGRFDIDRGQCPTDQI